MYSVLKDK